LGDDCDWQGILIMAHGNLLIFTADLMKLISARDESGLDKAIEMKPLFIVIVLISFSTTHTQKEEFSQINFFLLWFPRLFIFVSHSLTSSLLAFLFILYTSLALLLILL
jgi:hypothetical protein